MKVGNWLQSMSQFVKRDVVISLFALWFPPKLLTFQLPKGTLRIFQELNPFFLEVWHCTRQNTYISLCITVQLK